MFICLRKAAPALRANQNTLPESNVQPKSKFLSRGRRMFWKEIRGVLRGLRRNLGFTTLTVAILAIGMGASISVFSIVNSVLLKPLPFPDAERIFTIWDAPPPQMNLGFAETPLHG